MNPIYRKSLFNIPPGMIYLDGNSLGPPLKEIESISESVIVKEWGGKLIKGWNESNWMEQPLIVGNKIANLIGGDKGSIVAGDTLSIKTYQALAAAIKLNPQRNIILTDIDNFPSDIYIAEGLVDTLNSNFEVRKVKSTDILSSLTKDVNVVLLTHVNYKTGAMFDIEAVTNSVHENGSTIIWDLAHSAGAIPLDLKAINCEFAVGCTYKFLNGGPGSPAFIYVRPDLIKKCYPILRGWLGHKAPFDFTNTFEKSASIEMMRVGTPPVIQMAILEKALDIFRDLDFYKLREESIKLSDLFINMVEQTCSDLQLESPIKPSERGSQVSFSHPSGYAIMQALIDRNIVGDFRAPDIIRFGITPLYINEKDIIRTVKVLEDILSKRLWDTPAYLNRKKVT
ncbi:MAG: kynureninase [Alphaproteobacteria bacterium]|nr:MAG: kynureninase [Alphaproteobacteria bacterium]|tara:strand:- start:301 stop:1491 length:1191 start_codon:yes stop_codon:yes gene_type:complete